MPLELGLLQCLVAVALWALVHADLLSSQTVALQIGLLVVSLLAPQSPGRDEGVAWGCFLVPLLCAVCALLQADRSTQVYFVELADMAGVLSIATFWDGHLLVRALCIAIANPLRDRRVSFLVAGVYLTLMHRNSALRSCFSWLRWIMANWSQALLSFRPCFWLPWQSQPQPFGRALWIPSLLGLHGATG
eukprot:m.247485 g.247485  ORF g.247485 m.247485 type:complete len:190 (-) comp54479_c0_seq58:891-1460(-)